MTKEKISRLEEKRDKLTARLQKHYQTIDKLRVEINQIDTSLDALYAEHKRELKATT